MCTIVHIWKGENEPQAGGRRRPLRVIRNYLDHWTLATGTSRRSRARAFDFPPRPVIITEWNPSPARR